MAEIEVPFVAGTVVAEFPRGVEIEKREDSDSVASTPNETEFYHVIVPNASELPTFEELDSAELWVDVYFAVGGFVEDDTGGRGVPPEVAAAGNEVLTAYLMTRPEADVESVADFFDVSKNTIYSYLSRARSRGKDARDATREQARQAR